MQAYIVNAAPDVGEWRHVSFSPPFNQLPGDTYRTSGNVVYLVRGGVDVDARLITTSTLYTPPAVTVSQSVSELVFFRSKPMRPATATVVNVTQSGAGAINVQFSNGNGRAFDSWAQLGELADQRDGTTTLAEDLLITKIFRNSPDGSNMHTCDGASCTIDGDAANPVQFDFPE